MYQQVNPIYRNEMVRETRRPTKITGTIEINKVEDNYFTFENKDIVEKSLTIDNSIEGDSYVLQVGSAYMGRCVLSLKSGKLNGEDVVITKELQKKFQGKKMYISLTQYYTEKKIEDYTDADEHDTIPLGVWKISSVENVADNKFFNITAYDNMDNFDEPLTNHTFQNKRISEILFEACEYCGGIPLMNRGLIDNLSPIDVSTQRPITLTIDTPNENIPTWRALISQMCSIMGCVSFMDREGTLVFKRIAYNVEGNINGRLSHKMIKGLKYDEVHNAYNSVTSTVKGHKLTTKADIPSDYEYKENTTFYDVDLGSFDYHFKEGILTGVQQEAVNRHLLDYLTSFGGTSTYKRLNYLRTASGEVEYILGDPCLELGDVLLIEIKTDEGSGVKYIDFPITSYSWTYHGGHKLKSIGLDRNVLRAASQTQQTQQTAKTMSAVYNNMLPIVGQNEEEISILSTSSKNVVTLNGISNRRGILLLTGQIMLRTSTSGGYVRLNVYDGIVSRRIGVFRAPDNTQDTIVFNTYLEYIEKDAPSSLTLQIETNAFTYESPAVIDAQTAKFIAMPYWR